LSARRSRDGDAPSGRNSSKTETRPPGAEDAVDLREDGRRVGDDREQEVETDGAEGVVLEREVGRVADGGVDRPVEVRRPDAGPPDVLGDDVEGRRAGVGGEVRQVQTPTRSIRSSGRGSSRSTARARPDSNGAARRS
jgi:hypothetical protein